VTNTAALSATIADSVPGNNSATLGRLIVQPRIRLPVVAWQP
jgi:hypothetical protein